MTAKVIAYFLLVNSNVPANPMKTAVAGKRNIAPAEETFTAEKSQGPLLGEGDHRVTIESVARVEAPENDQWSDQTPQLAIKYKNDSGSITQWANLRGFVPFDELSAKDKASGKFEPRGQAGYAVNVETNERIEDPERTRQGKAYVAALGVDALGLQPGTGFKPSQLVGEEVGIHVEKNKLGKLRVMYTMHAEDVDA